MKRSIWFWLYFVIAIILAVYFATQIIITCTGRGDLSYVRNISITADVANKDLTPIAAAAAVVISPMLSGTSPRKTTVFSSRVSVGLFTIVPSADSG